MPISMKKSIEWYYKWTAFHCAAFAGHVVVWMICKLCSRQAQTSTRGAFMERVLCTIPSIIGLCSCHTALADERDKRQ